MNFRYRPGMRSVKTVVAVFVCLVVSYLVLRRETAFYSCIAAIVCMQPTYEQSFEQGLQRLIGTMIGGLVGYFALTCSNLLPVTYRWILVLLLPLFLLLAIYLCNLFGQEKSTSICCVVLLSIAINHGETVPGAVVFALNRVFDTAIGVLVSIAVNRWFFPSSFHASDGDSPPDSQA